MSKRSIIMCACSVVLLVYLAFAERSHRPWRKRSVGATHINVADSLHTGFITADDIARDFAPGLWRVLRVVQ